MQRRHLIAAAVTFPLVASFSGSPARARGAGVFNTGGVAIRGSDTVAYFDGDGPARGNWQHAVKWAGSLWYFRSEENRSRFEMNPRAYAPGYGGFCAFAMAEGRLVPTDPEAWTIADGRLFLNESLAVRAEWRRDVARYVALADAHWPALAKG